MLEREYSTYGFHQQVNLVERTGNDDLRAMSYGLGIATVVLRQKNGARSKRPSRCAAEQGYKFAPVKWQC